MRVRSRETSHSTSFFKNFCFKKKLRGAGTITDKPDFEKLHLINQLDEDDKTTVFKIVDTMLTKKKFKDFFAKNVAML